MKRAKEVKGIRALACALLFDIGKGITPEQPKSSKDAGESWETYNHKYWGWVDGDEDKISAAVVKYANVILSINMTWMASILMPSLAIPNLSRLKKKCGRTTE